MSPDFRAGVEAAIKVLNDHGWTGIAPTVHRHLLGEGPPAPVDPGELRIWRAI